MNGILFTIACFIFLSGIEGEKQKFFKRLFDLFLVLFLYYMEIQQNLSLKESPSVKAECVSLPSKKFTCTPSTDENPSSLHAWIKVLGKIWGDYFREILILINKIPKKVHLTILSMIDANMFLGEFIFYNFKPSLYWVGKVFEETLIFSFLIFKGGLNGSTKMGAIIFRISQKVASKIGLFIEYTRGIFFPKNLFLPSQKREIALKTNIFFNSLLEGLKNWLERVFKKVFWGVEGISYLIPKGGFQGFNFFKITKNNFSRWVKGIFLFDEFFKKILEYIYQKGIFSLDLIFNFFEKEQKLTLFNTNESILRPFLSHLRNLFFGLKEEQNFFSKKLGGGFHKINSFFHIQEPDNFLKKEPAYNPQTRSKSWILALKYFESKGRYKHKISS